MLVDAIHPEETRVVVTSGNRLEEFDFESATRRQLRGNIYLAKVTRVEPSLQAAFIEYGGNRHGFLAFSEIHPDYYQIPVADREALLRAEEEHEQEEAEALQAEAVADALESSGDNGAADNGDSGDNGEHPDDDEDGEHGHIEQAPKDNEPVESMGAGDALEEVTERRRPAVNRRSYKIQEVIKRRQVMLVQVVKEERGNKGAALTTYLSLAGRYSVLMPNTARGGGISRKITNAADRKRLKEIVGDLDVPPGQGIILRTAGASRTKAEVKRDFEYLQRLWENVRTLTLRSQAPCLVYEEGSLIKRTIRDLYNKDIDEVLVAGEDAYREAKDFMKMIMPSHAKNVQLYKDDQPVFSKYGVESQLDQMFSPQVTLPSGGYLVINPTEALVSIDVNSGRSTREHNIEDTALQTNLEAAEEVARQLRLRDLAGLIVIDFIDMMENRSNRAVERKLKEALKSDRARIQVGRISHFGLMEMSRQRIRFGVVESSTHVCPVCQGTGIVRSTESVALMVMRAVEDHVLRKPGQSIAVKVPTDVALYILNYKRPTLSQLEAKYDLTITIVAEDHLVGTHFVIERGESRGGAETRPSEHVRVDSAAMEDVEAEESEAEDAEAPRSHDGHEGHGEEGEHGRRRRRRRRGHGGERPDETRPRNAQPAGSDTEDEDLPDESEDSETAVAHAGEEEPRKRRRRGRRGGRRNRRLHEETEQTGEHAEASAAEADEPAPLLNGAAGPAEPLDGQETSQGESGADPESEAQSETRASEGQAQIAALLAEETVTAESEPVPNDIAAEEKPKRTRRSRKKPEAEVASSTGAEAATVDGAAPEASGSETEPVKKPRRTRKKAAPAPEPSEVAAAAESVSIAEPVSEAEPGQPAEAAAAPEAAEEATAEPSSPPADAPSPRRRKQVPEEGIVVSSAAPGTEAEGEAAKPKKAGWWQRGFFGS
jgi:ribonuclease E